MYEPKKFGFSVSFSIVVANIIGVGVFTSLGYQLYGVSDYRSILLLWILGGIIALIGSFAYGELSAANPKSGGEYHFLNLAYGRLTGFLAGWLSITLGFAAPIAAAAYAFGDYFRDIFPGVQNPTLVSVILIWLITLIHCLKQQVGGSFQKWVTLGKIILLVLFIAAAFIKRYDRKGFDTQFLFTGSIGNDVLQPAFWTSLIFVSYAYSGWNASTYMIEDIDNPKKNVPRSLLAGTGLVLILYTLINLTFLLSGPAEAMRGQSDVAFVSAKFLFGEGGANVVAGLITFFLVSTISSMILVAPRVMQRISIDYPSLSYFSKKSKNGIPIRAILFQSILATIILLTNRFDYIIKSLGFYLTLSSTLAVFAVIVLRQKYPEMERPLKTPFYPFLNIIFCVFNLWVLYYVLMDSYMQVLAGGALIASGLVVYYFFNRKALTTLKKVSAILVPFILVISCTQPTPEKNSASTGEGHRDSLTIDHEVFILNQEADSFASALVGNDTHNFSSTNIQKANDINRSWKQTKSKILDPIDRWMEDSLKMGALRSPSTLFYPFSGPDIAFAYTFYPNANTFILAGLEPVRDWESLLKRKDSIASSFLNNVHSILRTSNSLGFFRTIDMSYQFKENGVAPMLLFYLKQFDAKIGGVNTFKWDKEKGDLVKIESNSQQPDVCEIEFKVKDRPVQKLFYFSKDLSDNNLSKDTAWIHWVEKTTKGGNMASLTKSASYLMHSSGFSKVRNFILQKSSLHIQDDSGIAYRYMLESGRELNLFGNYTRVINLFKGYIQGEMLELYNNGKARPLSFKIGYNAVFGESNLQVLK
jgi:APA family basic amino acid/polyamine antiporter